MRAVLVAVVGLMLSAWSAIALIPHRAHVPKCTLRAPVQRPQVLPPRR